jgi:hypothetical protein
MEARRMTRWKAIATYRTETGPVEVTHDLAEIGDLHDLIERGPHWDTIIDIRITRAGAVDRSLTAEAARMQ